MVNYKTSDFKKGLKVQLDGEPYLMVEMNFVKPGKGNALYKCKLKNLLRGNVIDRTYKGGDSLEGADVVDASAQYIYRSGDDWVFLHQSTFEQHELSRELIGDTWKYLKEEMVCQVTFFNGNPIAVSAPNHVELTVEFAEPGVKGDTATNVTKSVRVETGADFTVPGFVETGDVIRIDTRTGEYLGRVRN